MPAKFAVEYLQRIPITVVLSYVPDSLYPLLVTNSRLHKYLVNLEHLWLDLLSCFKDDCALCWCEGGELCKLTGLTPRAELRVRVAQRRVRAEWRVKFATRVFFHNPQPPARDNECVVHPQQPAPATNGRGRKKKSRIHPLDVPDAHTRPVLATESAIEGLLDTFLGAESRAFAGVCKWDRKHVHGASCGGPLPFLGRSSPWYRERIIESGCPSRTAEARVVRDLSVAVGGTGAPAGVFWYSTDLAVDGVRQLLVAVALYACGNGAIGARVAGAVVLPSVLAPRNEYGCWLHKVAVLDT